jgi:hypothetical protein
MRDERRPEQLVVLLSLICFLQTAAGIFNATQAGGVHTQELVS